MTPPDSPQPPVDDRWQQARIAYVQMKTMTILALIFAACGLFVFIQLYDRYMAQDLMAALKNPATLAVVIVPFVPALILSFFARRAEKRYLTLMKSD